MENPLKEHRLKAGFTIGRLAARVEVSKQFIIRAEQGCYTTAPEPLVEFWCEREDVLASDIEREYFNFQHWKRKQSFGKLIEPWSFPEIGRHPFILWREYSGIKSEAAVCVLFCLHPAVMYKFEKGKMTDVPEMLTAALLESGYSAETVNKLEVAYEKWRIIKNSNQLEIVEDGSDRQAI